MKFVILICCLIPFVSSLKLNCEYGTAGWGAAAGTNYFCLVNNVVVNSPNVTIENIDGDHLIGKSNADVLSIKFKSSPDLKYFPKGLEKFFNNLESIHITETGLVDITSSDLKPFPKLDDLRLSKNKLTTLESGLFQFNPLLNKITLNGNQLNSIPADILDPIDPVLINLGQNVCIDTNATGRKKVEAIKKEIAEKCQN